VPSTVDRNDDERQLLLEQRNKLAREISSLQNGIRLRDVEIDNLHTKISSLGLCLCLLQVLNYGTHFIQERDHVIHHDGSAELVTRCSLLSGQQRSCDQLCQVIQEYQQRIALHSKYLTKSVYTRPSISPYIYMLCSFQGFMCMQSILSS